MIYLVLDLYFATFFNWPTYLFLIPIIQSRDFSFYFKLILIYDFFFIKSSFLFSLIVVALYLLNHFLKIDKFKFSGYFLKYLIFYSLFYIISYLLFSVSFSIISFLITTIITLFSYKKRIN